MNRFWLFETVKYLYTTKTFSRLLFPSRRPAAKVVILVDKIINEG